MRALKLGCGLCWRPDRVERIEFVSTSEVEWRRARSILGWGTAQEDLRVLPAYLILSDFHFFCSAICLSFAFQHAYLRQRISDGLLYLFHTERGFPHTAVSLTLRALSAGGWKATQPFSRCSKHILEDWFECGSNQCVLCLLTATARQARRTCLAASAMLCY